MKTDTWPPTFTLQQESILRLFTGERFYSNVDASIREAVLNAIDAIGRRKETEPSLIPDISVAFDRQSQTVTVTDNGDGMGKAEVARLFTTIGASASTMATTPTEQRYRAIGEFGIGVLSYFLICDKFEIHSTRDESESIGLEFRQSMLDGKSPARPIESRQSVRGTTLVLSVAQVAHFQRLVDCFRHWIRDVDGLSAREYPRNTAVEQGGLSREVRRVEIDTPEWIDSTAIGPPVLFDTWDRFDGSAHVDVLYGGVFVDQVSIGGLWAIEGAIHVDPKHFKPQLNREGFVGDKLTAELEPVLRAAHPAVLESAIECIRDVERSEKTKKWSLDRWVTLWLAVPRTGGYQRAASLWDEEFRAKKAFRLLTSGETAVDVSVQDLVDLHAQQIYVAPLRLQNADQVVQQAVRVLRNSSRPVVQGISREEHFLRDASLVGASTGDLLANHFRTELPDLVSVERVAADVVRQEGAVSILENAPSVKLVNLGETSNAIIPVGSEIWINVDCPPGQEILEEICNRNEGHLGVWTACIRHAGQNAQQIANILKRSPSDVEKLGPVKRAFLRTLSD